MEKMRVKMILISNEIHGFVLLNSVWVLKRVYQTWVQSRIVLRPTKEFLWILQVPLVLISIEKLRKASMEMILLLDVY